MTDHAALQFRATLFESRVDAGAVLEDLDPAFVGGIDSATEPSKRSSLLRNSGLGRLEVAQDDLGTVFEGSRAVAADRDCRFHFAVWHARFDDHTEIASRGQTVSSSTADSNELRQPARNVTTCELRSSCHVAEQTNTEVVPAIVMSAHGEGLLRSRWRTRRSAGTRAELPRRGPSQLMSKMHSATAAERWFA